MKMSEEYLDFIRSSTQMPDIKYGVDTVDDLLEHIDALEEELGKYRKPVETPILNMAEVHKLLTAAGWICYDDGIRFNRGLERMTVTYTNGVFRWAWKDGQRIENFNDLLTV